MLTGGGIQSGRVALDVGIVCPQAMGHIREAAGGALGAAEEYVRTKCSRAEVEQRCREAGVIFQPMIFESFGGVACEAERVIKSLNKAVAVNEDSSQEVVATLFWQRVGIDILRGNCRAFRRRVAGMVGDISGTIGPLDVAGGF